MNRWRAPFLILAMLMLPIGLRAAAIVLDHTDFGLADVRGFATDLLLATVFATLAHLALGWQALRGWPGRVLATGLLLLWAVLAFGNFEHILANDANLDPVNLKYLTNKEFIQGSALRVSHPVLTGLLGTATLAFFVLGVRQREPKPMRPVALRLLLGLVALMLWPLAGDTLTWRQECPAFSLIRIINGQAASAPAAKASIDNATARAKAADLTGAPRFAFPKKAERPPNVLIIMMEGLTGAYVPAIAEQHGVKLDVQMPKLSALAKANVTAASMIAHQRQTDRGEYAILCGDLPKLSRVTPRMTDVAQKGADRVCLPEYLRQKGYQTIYLQPAPMTFMLKDQFMGKIGFDESRGADFFATGYKKGGWGIDDRAFFEQSLEVLEEKEKSGPWMAALMTVGTHHPLIVPTSFKKKKDEEKFAWAARYTDLYLSRMIESMRKKGLLDHTIVVLTSDEARGINSHYQGVTRSISQNWSPMVALLPGGEQAMITEPYAHSDIALSVVDYAGLNDGSSPFLGRSLFRSYAEPRTLAFSNIFKRRAYLLDGANALTSCDENFSKCMSFTRKDGKFFGPGWKKRGTTQGKDVGRLRRVVAWSARTQGASESPSRVALVAGDTGVVEITRDSGWGMYLFGGQFLYGPEGKKVVVEVDLEVDGEGAAVHLAGVLNVEYKDRLKLPKMPPMFDGDRLHVRYTYTHKGPLKRVDAGMFARRLLTNRARLIIHKAEARFVPLAPGEDPDAGAKIEVNTISYRDAKGAWRSYTDVPRTKRHFSIFDAPGYRRRPCVKQTDRGALMGTRCRRDKVIVGPYQAAPANTRVRARFVVRGTKGKARIYADIADDWGKKIHQAGDRRYLKLGEEVEVTVETTLEHASKALEGRLVLEPQGGAPADFELLEGTLDLEPLRGPFKPSANAPAKAPVSAPAKPPKGAVQRPPLKKP